MQRTGSPQSPGSLRIGAWGEKAPKGEESRARACREKAREEEGPDVISLASREAKEGAVAAMGGDSDVLGERSRRVGDWAASWLLAMSTSVPRAALLGHQGDRAPTVPHHTRKSDAPSPNSGWGSASQPGAPCPLVALAEGHGSGRMSPLDIAVPLLAQDGHAAPSAK